MEETLALVRKFLDALDSGDGAAAAALLDEDVAFDIAPGRREIGREPFRIDAAERMARGERRHDVAVMASPDGTRAAAEFTLKGRGANGESWSVPAGIFFAVADGRIERLTFWGFPPA